MRRFCARESSVDISLCFPADKTYQHATYQEEPRKQSQPDYLLCNQCQTRAGLLLYGNQCGARYRAPPPSPFLLVSQPPFLVKAARCLAQNGNRIQPFGAVTAAVTLSHKLRAAEQA